METIVKDEIVFPYCNQYLLRNPRSGTVANVTDRIVKTSVFSNLECGTGSKNVGLKKSDFIEEEPVDPNWVTSDLAIGERSGRKNLILLKKVRKNSGRNVRVKKVREKSDNFKILVKVGERSRKKYN